MRAVVQRVSEARVRVDSEVVGEIRAGLLVFLGVGREDTEKDVDFLAEKISNLRIFPDEAQKMNLSLLDSGGAMLVVSQFTLHGDCRKGRRPAFIAAAPPSRRNHCMSGSSRMSKNSGPASRRAASAR